MGAEKEVAGAPLSGPVAQVGSAVTGRRPQAFGCGRKPQVPGSSPGGPATTVKGRGVAL